MVLFSQIQSDTSTWLSVVTSVANMGFAALVGWYLLTKAIPKMQEQYTQSQSQSRDQFLVDIKSTRGEFLTEIKEARTYADTREIRGQTEAKAALQAVIQHCERESQRRDENLKIEMSLVSVSIKDQREVLEELRDALRDMKSAVKSLTQSNINSNPTPPQK
jgi:hypothetical protein